MNIALISDIHANIYALESVFEDLNHEFVDQILVAGDLIGYYYWPKEVVNLLMSDSRVSCIKGNHEVILQEIVGNRQSAESYRKKYGSGYDVCLEALSSGDLEWLLGLPDSLVVEFENCSFHLSHASLASVDEYIYPDSSRSQLERCCSNHTFTVLGHTHYAFVYNAGNRFLLNPGSVGQPRDIGGLASYALVNLENLTIRFKRKIFEKQAVISMATQKDPELPYLRDIMNR